MNKRIIAVAVLSWAMGTGMALAHGTGEAHDESREAVSMENQGSAQTITGEVVDLACYLGHGELGPGHRDCAQKCIASGLPVGIKSKDELYLVVGTEHNPANKTLASLAAKKVTAEGTVTEKDGMHLIAVKKVTVNN